MARACAASRASGNVARVEDGEVVAQPMHFEERGHGAPYRARRPGDASARVRKTQHVAVLIWPDMRRKMAEARRFAGHLMRSNLRVALMVGLGMALGAATASLGADATDDPYLWLEDIHGQKPLDWVKQRNDVALKQLKSDPSYQRNYEAILAVLDATDRIPFGQVYFSHVFNFWQDETHVRGIWRRTTIESYETRERRNGRR